MHPGLAQVSMTSGWSIFMGREHTSKLA